MTHDEFNKPGSAYYGSPRLFSLAGGVPTSPARDARVLLFSQRYIEQPVWHGGMYEFEDLLLGFDDVQLLAPRRQTCSAPTRFGRQLHASARLRLGLPRIPDSEAIRVEGNYDLFFAVFHFTWQATYLRQLRDWRKRCRKAVCFIIEQWQPGLATSRAYLEMLGEFDHVFVFSRWSIPEMRSASGTTVTYLPIATDALASCPYPQTPPRTIDIFSMGRTVECVHDVLLKCMQDERLTYLFDSISVGRVPSVNHVEHRMLLRHLLKRSQYFLAFRHNDSPEFLERTGGEEAIASRYFEAIAGGPVLLGSAPECQDYRDLFDWPDALIPLPADEDGIVRTLQDLDEQPERRARASACNVLQALRRHDWVHRWQTILRAAGLSDSAGMTQRVAQLIMMADMIREVCGV